MSTSNIITTLIYSTIGVVLNFIKLVIVDILFGEVTLEIELASEIEPHLLIILFSNFRLETKNIPDAAVVLYMMVCYFISQLCFPTIAAGKALTRISADGPVLTESVEGRTKLRRARLRLVRCIIGSIFIFSSIYWLAFCRLLPFGTVSWSTPMFFDNPETILGLFPLLLVGSSNPLPTTAHFVINVAFLSLCICSAGICQYISSFACTRAKSIATRHLIQGVTAIGGLVSMGLVSCVHWIICSQLRVSENMFLVVRCACMLHFAALSCISDHIKSIKAYRKWHKSQSGILNLPDAIIDHSAATKGNNNDELFEVCPICFGDIDGEIPAKKLSCGHVIHTDCLLDLFSHSSECPVCRKPIKFIQKQADELIICEGMLAEHGLDGLFRNLDVDNTV
ncbi:hypothetical protein ADUPG1_011724 [Aduncisulcus paluster]|uniref:RING-type domain-containing protein n=1 Tax=Aduncisulcus paluster TaxID=2918883 RepID=A0ABQ5JXQ1_9EUKA|nr:hypothetical protein ADUPG1_011724 [Aduncisulcus paluster]